MVSFGLQSIVNVLVKLDLINNYIDVLTKRLVPPKYKSKYLQLKIKHLFKIKHNILF
jgi:hypothetical protein